ncbi:MAG: pre-peptidase C-terminal domain-containing protein, partial [Cyanobacteria bacterium J06600_6]
MSLEPNNLIIEAIPSGVDFSTKNSLTLSESIDSLTDVDLYQFQLNKGQGITLDVTTASGDDPAGFDSFLRIFDSDGNELAKNDDASDLTSEFSLDAYAGFIANSSGNYYVGISSSENQNYEPIQGSDLDLDSENFSGGDYDLTFTLLEVVADEDPDNTLPEAIAIEVDPETQQAAIEGTIEFESDADLYRLEIPEASGVRLNLS